MQSILPYGVIQTIPGSNILNRLTLSTLVEFLQITDNCKRNIYFIEYCEQNHCFILLYVLVSNMFETLMEILRDGQECFQIELEYLKSLGI